MIPLSALAQDQDLINANQNELDLSTGKATSLPDNYTNQSMLLPSNELWPSTQQFKILTKKELKEERNLIKNDPASAKEYKAYQTANSISWVLLACSFGGTIYSLINVSKYIKETDEAKEDIYAKRTVAGLAIGFGCLLIDWPVNSAGRKHLKKAIELYDTAHRQVSMENVSLFYSSGGMQIGLEFKF